MFGRARQPRGQVADALQGRERLAARRLLRHLLVDPGGDVGDVDGGAPHLEHGTTRHAVRIRHDEPGAAPDDPRAAAGRAATDFDNGAAQQITESVEV